MAWMAGVIDILLTTPGIEVLGGRELGPSDVLGCLHHPLLRFAVKGGAIAKPSCDAASQDALNGAEV